MSIGSRLKSARINKNLTQEELAKMIGVTKGAIANYENQVSIPKIKILLKLFSALECDANYVYQDDMVIRADKKNKSAAESSELTDEQKLLLEKFEELNTEGQKKLLDYANDLTCSRNYTKNNSDEIYKQA